jgi:urea transporter
MYSVPVVTMVTQMIRNNFVAMLTAHLFLTEWLIALNVGTMKYDILSRAYSTRKNKSLLEAILPAGKSGSIALLP